MPRQSVLRRTVGWTIVALGGAGLVIPQYMLFSRYGSVRGAGLRGTYFETSSILHVPAWAIGGLVLVFVGFAIMADPVDETDEE